MDPNHERIGNGCAVPSARRHLFLQLLGQPLVGREFLVAAATACRGLGGLAGQLLQPVDLGLERRETNRNGYCGHWMLKLKAKGDIQCPKSSMW